MGFDFDFDLDTQSALIGYGAGLLTGYALYQSRHVLSAIRRTLTSQADTAQSLARMGGDRRYSNELTKYGLHHHLFHEAIELGDILVEPRFIRERDISEASDDENERLNPFDLIPIVPDHPYLHQPFNIPTINIDELGLGERAIALLGLPGSGRTTALLTIALWSMSRLEFEEPHDPVAERLQDEFNDMSRQEQDEQQKARVAIQQRAREQIREELGRDVGDNMDAFLIPPFKKMVPIYIHLANVRLSSWNGNVDPAEPMIRALQYQTGSITSKTIPRKIYNFLNDGVCLLLFDGLDALPPREQTQKINWLKAFLDEYSENFMIVTGQPCGYGGLQKVGFTPVHLKPWSYQDTKSYVEWVSSNWNKIANTRFTAIEDEDKPEILQSLWGLNPFETTIKLREILTDRDNAEIEDYADWTHQHLISMFDDAEDAIPMMSLAATQQLDNHFFTLNEWVDSVIELELSSNTNQPAIDQESDISEEPAPTELEPDDDFSEFEDDLNDEFEQEPITAETSGDDEEFASFEEDDIEASTFQENFTAEVIEQSAEEAEPKDETKEARQIRRTVGKLLSTLMKAGLVDRFQGNRYRFRHIYIASYLGSLSLLNADEKTLAQKAKQPSWSLAIAFAGSQVDITIAVETKMQNTTDILHTNALDVAYWIRYASEHAELKKKYLAYLGQMFVSPSQYLTSRERIAAALITTRDMNARKVFGRGTQHPSNDVKRISILALGAYQQEELMDNLSAFLTAPEEEIRVVSAFAIGNIHTENAYQLLTEELLETNTESVQQVIAETFADNPEVGYEILWEILKNEDYQNQIRLRRAAILGIQRLRTEWSLIEIYRTYIESEQWYVKSTAQVAFTERQSQNNKGAKGFPQITTLPWLQEWSLSLDEETTTELSGVELLNMALREENPLIRYLATSNSGQLGVYENLQDIYRLLNDPEDAIRDTAFRALVDMQMKIGRPLPVPR